MALKRKATAAKAEPAPKRSSRPSKEDKPKKKSTAASSSSSKGKSKASKVITIDDSSDEEDQQDSDDDVMVVEDKPAASSSKSKGKVKKDKAPPKVKATPKVKSKAALAATAPISPEPSSPPPATKPKPSPKKALSFEESLRQWFESFVEDEEEKKKGVMGGEGIEKMFEDMGASMEGALPFLLAWKLNAKPGTFGSYYLADMERLFRESKITTSPALKKYLTSIESTMYPAAPPKKKSSSSASAAARPDNYADQQLCDFYAFLFPFIKEEGQKSLNGQMAVAVWGVVLAPRYPIAKSFVEYASSPAANIKGVSQDVWSQLYEFVSTVGEDLSGWSEEDAWPSHIDAFVEWRKEQDQTKA